MNRSITTRLLIATLTFALCGAPELIAQSANPLPDAPSAVRLVAQNTTAQSPNVSPVPAGPAQQESAPAQQPAPTQDSPRVVPVDPQKATGTEDEQQPSAESSSQQDTTKPVIAPTDPAEVQKLENAQQQKKTAAPVNERINPLGTAAAEKGQTAGGAASRPAGVAIAPAKQKRSRSLLIKLGAVAAAGAAIGTVYALSKGTSSVPAGAVR